MASERKRLYENVVMRQRSAAGELLMRLKRGGTILAQALQEVQCLVGIGHRR